tara:strand:- start:784 stop:933 length:150 start_codon:yes stop_codon:yes gene_type:complete
VKALSSTEKLLWKLMDWRTVEVCGTQGVAVKCVDILKNTREEADRLGCI